MKNIKYFVGAVCLALSLNSCSDFLNEEPVSEIPAGDMWQTARDAKAGINEIYGLLRSTLRENYFYWGEFRSDNVAPGAPVMADQARVINNLMSTDEKCAKWTTLYQMINQTNLAIKYIPNISMPDVADRNDYLGQVLWPTSMLSVFGETYLCLQNLLKSIRKPSTKSVRIKTTFWNMSFFRT